ncbi:MAG TPA: hypothetical protein VN643_20330 [Pyrinomonadaceae bacterium]|nr:hypothetical protein [Pyrinomonadaceae bacterium]
METNWAPPHAFDASYAWNGSLPNFPDMSVRVEAASLRGKPVYFEMVFPWSRSGSADIDSTAEKVGTGTLLVVFFGSLILGAMLALRNLRSGRCDRRGAFRVVFFVFIVRMIAWVFITHHVVQSQEIQLLVTGIQSALFWSCFVGVMYLALEPSLRRRWPERIISWNRLLVGDFRDPLVGRDLLIGASVGAFCVAMMYLRFALPRWFSTNPGMPDMIVGYRFGLAGPSALAQMLTGQLTSSIGQAFIIVFMLLFFSLLFRRDWLGISIGSVIMLLVLVVPSLALEHWFGSVCIAIVVLVFVGCGLRLGPLGLISALMVFHLWVFYPVTTDLTAWYASSFITTALLLIAMATYGFYVSLAGQPLWGGKLLQDD